MCVLIVQQAHTKGVKMTIKNDFLLRNVNKNIIRIGQIKVDSLRVRAQEVNTALFKVN